MNITKELISVVSKIAPTLGAALGGPAGALVGALIGKLFGTDSTNPQDLLSLIGKDSEAAIKLKELENTYQTELIKIDAQNYVTEVDDRKSARDLAAKNEWQTFALAVGYLMFFVITCVLEMLGYAKLSPDLQTTLTMIAVMIGAFYFGSSKGERNATRR